METVKVPKILLLVSYALLPYTALSQDNAHHAATAEEPPASVESQVPPTVEWISYIKDASAAGLVPTTDKGYAVTTTRSESSGLLGMALGMYSKNPVAGFLTLDDSGNVLSNLKCGALTISPNAMVAHGANKFLMVGFSVRGDMLGSLVDRAESQIAVWDAATNTVNMGGTVMLAMSDAKETIDGGVVVAGASTIHKNQQNADAFVFKYTPSAESSLGVKVAWDFYDIQPGDAYLSAIIETASGDLIGVGYAKSPETKKQDALALKVDRDGRFVWRKFYGGPLDDGAISVTKGADGNPVLAGFSETRGKDDTDMFVVKINDNGDVIWSRTLEGSGAATVRCVRPTLDGGYILAGSRKNRGKKGQDAALLVKLAQDGTTVWETTLSDLGKAVATEVLPTADGNFVVLVSKRDGPKTAIVRLASNPLK